MHLRLHGSNNLLTLYQIEPDFPSSADEIAEPHLEMNIKVASFTVTQKFYNMHVGASAYWSICMLFWTILPTQKKEQICVIIY